LQRNADLIYNGIVPKPRGPPDSNITSSTRLSAMLSTTPVNSKDLLDPQYVSQKNANFYHDEIIPKAGGPPNGSSDLDSDSDSSEPGNGPPKLSVQIPKGPPGIPIVFKIKPDT